MALQIRVVDNKIHLELIQCPTFTEVVQALKSHKAQYRPSTHSWIIPSPLYEDVKDALSDLDVIVESEQTLKAIELIRKPPISIPLDRIEFSREELKVPPIVGKHPYENFQFEDLSKLVNRKYYALFNEQGTGKSWIYITALDLLRRKKDLKKILFLTSDSGVVNIKHEIIKFSDFDPSKVAIGGVKNRKPFIPEVDIIICNYRSFLLISDEYQKDIKRGTKKSKKYRKTPIPLKEWIGDNVSALVVDESHKIANPKARQSHVLHLVRDFFDYVYEGSGTPASDETKFYSQLKLMNPSLVHNFSYEEWLTEYCNLGNRFSSYAVNFFKPEKKQQLVDIVSKVSSKRLATLCLDLPEHLEQVIYVELSPLQKKIYEELTKEKLRELKNNQCLDLQSVKNLFPYFIEAIDNPLMLIANPKVPETVQKLAKRFSFDKHSKLEALEDLLEKHTINRGKVIVWTSHPSVGENLKDFLSKKYKCLVINGQSKPKEFKGTLDDYKFTVVDTFKNTDVQILIAGIQVLNSSVTITEATSQIFFDIDFNYVDVDQSKCRIYRIGQKRTVYTYYLLSEDSLDVVRYKMFKDKDFINKNFGNNLYLSQENLQVIFNAQGL